MGREFREYLTHAVWQARSLFLSQNNPAQQNAAAQLRESFTHLHSGSANNDLAFWQRMREELYQEVLKGDVKNFLSWPVIKKTMFHEPPHAELAYLRAHKEWPRWKRLLQEPMTGNPRPYPWYVRASGNSIHHVYSLVRFCDFAGIDLSAMKTIVEFGGGYGNFCRLAYAAGFTGQYIIFDLPEFSLLQRYYLSSTTSHEVNLGAMPWHERSIVLLSSLEELKKQQTYTPVYDLLMALWSLTESPLALRADFLLLTPANNYLIAYQEQFEGIDNAAFTKQFIEQHPSHRFENPVIPHIKGGQYYLFGQQK